MKNFVTAVAFVAIAIVSIDCDPTIENYDNKVQIIDSNVDVTTVMQAVTAMKNVNELTFDNEIKARFFLNQFNAASKKKWKLIINSEKETAELISEDETKPTPYILLSVLNEDNERDTKHRKTTAASTTASLAITISTPSPTSEPKYTYFYVFNCA